MIVYAFQERSYRFVWNLWTHKELLLGSFGSRVIRLLTKVSADTLAGSKKTFRIFADLIVQRSSAQLNQGTIFCISLPVYPVSSFCHQCGVKLMHLNIFKRGRNHLPLYSCWIVAEYIECLQDFLTKSGQVAQMTRIFRNFRTTNPPAGLNVEDI